MPEALGGPGGAAVNGEFFVMGGRDGVNTNRNIVYVYNIATNTWATGANIPSGVNVPGSAVIDGNIWIFGGGNPFAGPRTSPELGKKECGPRTLPVSCRSTTHLPTFGAAGRL